MDKSDIIALGFLIIGGAFVWTLLKSMWTLINPNAGTKITDSQSLLSVFKYPLISFIVLILFIIFVVN